VILYLYAIADGLASVEGIAGARGEPLTLIPLDAATLVAGSIAAAPALSRDVLAAQDACVRALHARAAALLPMRFGAALADVDAASRAIAAYGPMLRERLDLVRDREQVSLWIAGAARASGVSGSSGDEADAGRGRRYLEQRAAQQIPHEVRPIVESLKPLVRATRVEATRHEAAIATVYHLIDRGASATYFKAAHAAAEGIPDVRVRVRGPSPAYAFADLRLR
jgi:hypothetical protein